MVLSATVTISKFLLLVANVFKILQENVFIVSENLLKGLGFRVPMRHVSMKRHFV